MNEKLWWKGSTIIGNIDEWEIQMMPIDRGWWYVNMIVRWILFEKVLMIVSVRNEKLKIACFVVLSGDYDYYCYYYLTTPVVICYADSEI